MLLSQEINSNLSLKRKEREIPLQQYERGDEISVLDSGVWQVYRGVVQLSKVRQDGTEIILAWITANGVFGNCFESSVDNSTVFYRAVALSDVYVRRYCQQDLVNYPLLARQFLAQFSDRLIMSEHLLSIIAIRKVEERLRQFLLMLEREIGQSVADGVRLQVRFTHQHLAEAIHTTRVTVTRILGDFQERGLVYFDDERHIVVKGL
ncbi:Crp/Fnr family transcriptional regulator [Pleurocapsales cyanobacterium LEGE 10410]|nr:Crp/Fnr family transcriptional regulator [Pleurocapsales cyanobacterium LEGE 10410]